MKISVYFNLLPIFAFYLHFILKKFQSQQINTNKKNQYKQFMFIFIQISKAVEFCHLGFLILSLVTSIFSESLDNEFLNKTLVPIDGSSGKGPTCNAGDTRDSGLIPGSGRSPGGGHGNPLQCSCLQNPMDRGAWWATVHGVTQCWT